MAKNFKQNWDLDWYFHHRLTACPSYLETYTARRTTQKIPGLLQRRSGIFCFLLLHSLFIPAAIFFYVIAIWSAGRTIHTPFGTIRYHMEVVPFSVNKLPSSPHSLICVCIEPARQVCIIESTILNRCICIKCIPATIYLFPAIVYIGAAVQIGFYTS